MQHANRELVFKSWAAAYNKYYYWLLYPSVYLCTLPNQLSYKTTRQLPHIGPLVSLSWGLKWGLYVVSYPSHIPSSNAWTFIRLIAYNNDYPTKAGTFSTTPKRFLT